MPGSDAPKATALECVIPILRVLRLSTSIDYYVGRLGFKVDGHALMLCEGAQGNPGTWVWIGVHDAATLFDEYAAKGATIRRTPTNYPWAYEMHVEDPDGHILRFGSEPRSDRPFAAWSQDSTANTVVD
jgi:hypothetical protein